MLATTLLANSARFGTRAALRLPARAGIRSVSTLSPTVYTAVSTSKGTRARGASSTQDGNISVKMGLPKEMGGTSEGGPDSPANPEQLFGMGYSTCFLSALAATHNKLSPNLKPLPPSAAVTAKVSIGQREGLTGFFLAVELEVHEAPLKEVGLDDAAIKKLLQEAHQLCPYSRALTGNAEVEIRLAA